MLPYSFSMSPFIGVHIIEDANLLNYHEDWSRVRSPSRALRRRRQGHRQNITITATPKRDVFAIDGGRTLVMHPAVAAELRKQLKSLKD